MTGEYATTLKFVHSTGGLTVSPATISNNLHSSTSSPPPPQNCFTIATTTVCNHSFEFEGIMRFSRATILLLFAILEIVNYVAGKSADMGLVDYIVAAAHILLCQFCRNYRSYTRDLAVSDEDSDANTTDAARDSASSKLSVIKEDEAKEKEDKQTQQSVEFATLKEVKSASESEDAKRSSVSSQTTGEVHSTRLRGLSGSRSRSSSVRNVADLPASYKFVSGFDTMYDENKFETLATQLADDEFDWDAFGMVSGDSLLDDVDDIDDI
eukprot:230158_1